MFVVVASDCLSGVDEQAIASATAYANDWPLLIIAPSTARYHWEHELRRWLPKDFLHKDHVSCVSMKSPML